MNISNFISKRYLFAKKSRNIINLISLISLFGLLVSAASLVVILSGFNGIQKYVEDVYGKFSASIYVYPLSGKFIAEHDSIFSVIKLNNQVKYYSKVIEETAMLKFENKWVTATIKGVDSNTYNKKTWSLNLIEGNGELYIENFPKILLGYGLQNELQIPYNENINNEIKIFSISNKKQLSIQNQSSLKKNNLIFGGVYSINPELDFSSAMVDYKAANQIFERQNGANYLEIFLKDNKNIFTIKKVLEAQNPDYIFKTHKENNQLIYAASDAEKWMVLAVLIFVLILSSFTVISSITMLIIDKKKDIKSLIALGCNTKTIKNIFFKEGLMISYLGSISGLIIGTIICFIQMKFHLLKLENAAIDYWPVLIKPQDLMLLLAILFITGLVAAYLPGKILVDKLLKS
jgi:ABC-type lipoprotein release transport system permease subunit